MTTKLRRGFTLLELMVVIAITGILTSVALVQFEGAKRTAAVRGAAENFAAFLRTTENMSRVGMILPKDSDRADCNGDSFKELSPCGGYGVFVQTNQYYRFADNVNLSARAANTGDPQLDIVTLPSTLQISASPSAFPFTLLFVPPKDVFCINAQCGPAVNSEVVFTFTYTDTTIKKTVRVNTVSGLVSVE